jgi:hypothetical protein
VLETSAESSGLCRAMKNNAGQCNTDAGKCNIMQDMILQVNVGYCRSMLDIAGQCWILQVNVGYCRSMLDIAGQFKTHFVLETTLDK